MGLYSEVRFIRQPDSLPACLIVSLSDYVGQFGQIPEKGFPTKFRSGTFQYRGGSNFLTAAQTTMRILLIVQSGIYLPIQGWIFSPF